MTGVEQKSVCVVGNKNFHVRTGGGGFNCKGISFPFQRKCVGKP